MVKQVAQCELDGGQGDAVRLDLLNRAVCSVNDGDDLGGVQVGRLVCASHNDDTLAVGAGVEVLVVYVSRVSVWSGMNVMRRHTQDLVAESFDVCHLEER